MISLRWKCLPVVLLFAVSIFDGCGGGSGRGTTTAVNPQFTSTPVMGAEEGTTYTYQVTATSPDMSAVTFALSSAPMGATLAGNTITWTPTHQESRVPNAFTVTATTAAGGSATQTWNVTPNGNINITDVVTYWGASGANNVPRIWPSGALYPAALVPQSDGSPNSSYWCSESGRKFWHSQCARRVRVASSGAECVFLDRYERF